MPSHSHPASPGEAPHAIAVPEFWDVPIPTRPLKIAMLVVGTHGDLQPFLAIAQILVEHGHRIRVATHECYREVVKDKGHDFYPLAGDPAELSEFMVKHKGLMKPFSVVGVARDAPHQHKMARAILKSSWPAVCSGGFKAEAIITSPLCWGHVHVAEKLQVPLHVMFPQPWLPTVMFPHPISGWKPTGPSRINLLSYKLFEFGMWSAIKKDVQYFRKKLGLDPIPWKEGAKGLLRVRKVPHSFLWSESLVSKPHDWPDFAEIVGSVAIPDELDYQPEKKLADFLAAGHPPILITFGSMRIQKSAVVAHRILFACRDAKVRVIVQSGWSDLTTHTKSEANVLYIGSCPHTWLMPKCCAVVHHGGAGTTYASLKAGKPSMVCPFFGDQPFWGEALHKRGAALRPAAIEDLDTAQLTQCFRALHHSKEMTKAACKLRDALVKEDGAINSVQSFYRHLPRWQRERLKLMRQSSVARLKLNTEHNAPPSRGLGPNRAHHHHSHSRASSSSHHPRSPDSRLHSSVSRISSHHHDRGTTSGTTYSSVSKAQSKPATASTAVLEQMVAANGGKFGVSGSMQSMSESKDSLNLQEPSRKEVEHTPVIDFGDDSDWDALDSEEEEEQEEAHVKPFLSCPNTRQVPRRPAPSPAFWKAHARRRSSIERLDLAVSDETAAALHKVKPPLEVAAGMKGWASEKCLRKPRRDVLETR